MHPAVFSVFSVSDMTLLKTNKPTDSRKKRRNHVKQACLLCRRAHTACDETKPCSRCVKQQRPELCVQTIEEYNEILNSTNSSSIIDEEKVTKKIKRDSSPQESDTTSNIVAPVLNNPVPLNTCLSTPISNASMPTLNTSLSNSLPPQPVPPTQYQNQLGNSTTRSLPSIPKNHPSRPPSPTTPNNSIFDPQIESSIINNRREGKTDTYGMNELTSNNPTLPSSPVNNYNNYSAPSDYNCGNDNQQQMMLNMLQLIGKTPSFYSSNLIETLVRFNDKQNGHIYE